MAGKRAPEVALGHHLDYLRQRNHLKGTSLRQRLTKVKNPISHRDLAKNLKDFDTGFNGIIAYVALKLDMTQAEPFNVVGFAAWDEAAAKAHAQVVTARFDMVPALAVHDRIAVVRLSYGHQVASAG